MFTNALSEKTRLFISQSKTLSINPVITVLTKPLKEIKTLPYGGFWFFLELDKA